MIAGYDYVIASGKVVTNNFLFRILRNYSISIVNGYMRVCHTILYNDPFT